MNRAFDAFTRQDPDGIAATMHANGVLAVTGDLALFTGDRHEGRHAVRSWFGDWFATMELEAAEMEHTARVGDRVIAVGFQSSRAASAGVPATAEFAVVFSFRDGLIEHFHLFNDPEEARRSLGLHRWPWDEHTVAVESFDSPDALALRDELEADLAHRYGGGSEPGAKPTDETVLSFLVARDGQGGAVACGALLDLGSGVAEIKRMFVRPEHRGRGLSRHLLEALEREALRRGFDHIRLETGERQPEAMGLYRSAGYEEIECYGAYRDAPLSRCFEHRLR